MLTKSRITLATTLAAVALAAPPAWATPMDARGEHAASQSDRTSVSTGDARGEHAASLSDRTPFSTGDGRGENAASLSDRTDPAGGTVDLRGDAAREPFVQPVVVEVDDPVSVGFDWTAAIIGVAAGLALAVLAGVGVTGGRRRHGRPTTA